jgi:hypothetical protein
MASSLRQPALHDMAAHMKTTVEIADDLLRQAKTVAVTERTTLRALLEEGLRWALAKRRRRGRFKLRDASVPGKGVQPGVIEGDWAALRDTIYTGRGS